MKRILPLLIVPFLSGWANAGLYDGASFNSVITGAESNPSRIVPSGCSPDQPIDSCAPSVKPFDCAPGRHWTTQGGNGLAHCVDDDAACPTNYLLVHDSLGNPSCQFDPASQVQRYAPPQSQPPSTPPQKQLKSVTFNVSVGGCVAGGSCNCAVEGEPTNPVLIKGYKVLKLSDNYQMCLGGENTPPLYDSTAMIFPANAPSDLIESIVVDGKAQQTYRSGFDTPTEYAQSGPSSIMWQGVRQFSWMTMWQWSASPGVYCQYGYDYSHCMIPNTNHSVTVTYYE